jgi:hypothetical protein
MYNLSRLSRSILMTSFLFNFHDPRHSIDPLKRLLCPNEYIVITPIFVGTHRVSWIAYLRVPVPVQSSEKWIYGDGSIPIITIFGGITE